MKPKKTTITRSSIKQHTDSDVTRYMKIFAEDIESKFKVAVESIHGRMDTMEQRVDEKLNDFGSQLKATQFMVGKNTEAITGLRGDVDGLRKDMDANTAAIYGLRKDVDSNTKEISGLKDRVGEMDNRLSGKIDKIHERLDEHDEEIAALKHTAE